MDMMGVGGLSSWIYQMGAQHIAAVVISIIAALAGFRLSRQFGGEIGKALRFFCIGLLVITLPHTLEFFTVTFPSIPIGRDPVRLLKATFYIMSVSLFVYALYRLGRSVESGRRGT